VQKFGFQSDMLHQIAERFAEKGKVPEGYPTKD
jgi:hypothetical protein